MKDLNRTLPLFLAWCLLAAMLVAGCAGDAQTSEGDQGSGQTSDPVRTESNAAGSFSAENDDRSVAQKIEDASVATRVRMALAENGDLRAFDFETASVNGRVLLRGEVHTRAQREQAASLASGINGVRSVTNEITATEAPAIAESDSAEADTTAASDAAESGDALADAVDPGEGESESNEPAQDAATYHTVQSGDNLWNIARQYGVSIDQIRRLNNLGGSSIKPGQRLQVK